MKKSIIVSVGFLAFLGACSSDEEGVTPSSDTGKEINFYATAPKGTRANPTTTANLQSFKVYAYTDSTVLMDGVEVTREGGSWTYSPVVYWPASTVNFYALSPTKVTGSTTVGDDGKSVSNVSVGSDDWLYAVSMNRHESPSPVDLTFKHAMSRVSVLLSSTNEKYDVKVSHVSLKNISLKGSFTLPNSDTNIAASVATWSGLSDPNDILLYYDMDEKPTSLTPTPADLTEGNLEMSFFVPQHLQPFKYSTSKGFTGSYMQIDCEIFDKTTGTKIWPSEYTPEYLLVPETGCGMMAFPLSTDEVKSWVEGTSYVYNVVINNTYTLDKIEFNPTVEDYVQVKPY